MYFFNFFFGFYRLFCPHPPSAIRHPPSASTLYSVPNENEFNLHVNEISFTYKRMSTKSRFQKGAKGHVFTRSPLKSLTLLKIVTNDPKSWPCLYSLCMPIGGLDS